MRRAAGTFGMILACAATVSAQSDRPQFRTTVEIVQLQVSVAAQDGGFVSGLQPEDFLLRIDGERRDVQLVYEVDLRRNDGAGAVAMVDGAPQPRASAAPRPVAARRHWLLLFDFSFTSRRGVLEARTAGLDFVNERVHPDDLLAVATINRYGIRLLSPFTGNHRQAEEAVATLGLVDAGDLISTGFGAEESIAQALAEMAAGPAGTEGGIGAVMQASEFSEYVATVSNYTGQMRELGQMLQAIEGRKHVVMFSSGFDDRALTGQSLGELGAAAEERSRQDGANANAEAFANDPEQMYGSSTVREGLTDMIDMFRAADAVVHAVDPSGLRDAGAHDASRMISAVKPDSGGNLSSNAAHTGHQALVAMAEGTGGSADWAANDISVALAEIERTTATFYVIAYRKAAEDPATVEVSVQMARPDVQVVSAPSRLTPPPEYRQMNAMQRQLQLAEFLNDDVERREIAFESQIIAFPGDAEAARQVLVLEISGLELDRLALARGEGIVELEIGGFALDDEGDVLDSFRRRVAIDVDRMRQRGAMHEQSFRYTDHVETPPGEHRLRLLLREAEIGRLSSRTQRYWSPELSQRPAVARPMVLAGLDAPLPPDADQDRFDPLTMNGRRLLPIAAPVVSPGEVIRLLVVTYRVPRDAATGDVFAAVVIEAEDVEGDAYRLSEVEIIGSSYDERADATQLLIETRLPPHIRPGAGRLWARLIDQVTGDRVEEQTPLYVQSR